MQSADQHKRRILITGVAGFVGFHLARRLLHDYGDRVEIIGIDNLNDFFPELKSGRLHELGVDPVEAGEVVSGRFPGFVFRKMDIADNTAMDSLFATGDFDIVVHLAARASARYSAVNPREYLESNIGGFLNVLEGCRNNGVRHLLFASSSSVYGMNDKVPYSEGSDASHPVSFYAATKRSNELMAHSYASMYGLHVTALRFFSVYGPWCRPDMAPYLFIDAILHGRPIKVYNHGDMYRDFTYIDDVIEGIIRVIETSVIVDDKKEASMLPFRIFNIGNSMPVRLSDFIAEIERATGRQAAMELMPMQCGDVYMTCSDCSALRNAVGYAPSTSLASGMARTVEWFKEYYKID